ncbi:DUF3108 domain-containing protein [Psychromonas ossibalaenae]|uniref:DUF3108 domain-containing protein n=1 Tax=Psychromonas ossibalaenae TaxID=444922 RepID=UPI000370AF05|nr:DUF3108 domain-containing protein [Psychromonas ossibalaenae]
MFYKSLILLLFLSLNSSLLSALHGPQSAPVKQRYTYDLFYKKITVGEIIRELQYEGEKITADTRADLSFLYIYFGGNQLSEMYWDKNSQMFLSKSFQRNSVGFSRVSMTAEFFKDGHQSTILRNGKRRTFLNEQDKIIDFNTLFVQISEGLKAGKTHFEFYMQTSDSVEHYFFEVTAKEKIDSSFGKLDTYRLQQTGKNDRTLIAWFAPQIDYQMVKFIYKRKILDIRGELREQSKVDL